DLPASVTVSVIEDCPGRQTLMLMLLVAGLIAAVAPARKQPWGLGLLVAAVMLALETNALRVAGTTCPGSSPIAKTPEQQGDQVALNDEVRRLELIQGAGQLR